ncbi:hypothetical protein E5C33_04555 [Stenotrophomonas maltophilia]|uniref:hypothetical protein n=1 Tax=Stenotrophomonas maltophilia TaxID=40324 RepID=UPI0010761A9A|nr:hypothetical protein [Stenotrophomonas maltophilia]TFZ46471.1 hypothetical protein E5C33_04555 [Stenotrophomonas maltophilia]
MPPVRDGRELGIDSADWRLACEARRLLQLGGYRCMDACGRWRTVSPRRHRQQYLERVQAIRGHAERDRLAALALQLWSTHRPDSTRKDASR